MFRGVSQGIDFGVARDIGVLLAGIMPPTDDFAVFNDDRPDGYLTHIESDASFRDSFFHEGRV